MAAEWHITAHCINSACDWRFDFTGPTREIVYDRHGNARHDKAARDHESEAQHPTSVAMHRLHYCKELGCPGAGV
jgi:hypothetical protein